MVSLNLNPSGTGTNPAGNAMLAPQTTQAISNQTNPAPQTTPVANPYSAPPPQANGVNLNANSAPSAPSFSPGASQASNALSNQSPANLQNFFTQLGQLSNNGTTNQQNASNLPPAPAPGTPLIQPNNNANGNAQTLAYQQNNGNQGNYGQIGSNLPSFNGQNNNSMNTGSAYQAPPMQAPPASPSLSNLTSTPVSTNLASTIANSGAVANTLPQAPYQAPVSTPLATTIANSGATATANAPSASNLSTLDHPLATGRPILVSDENAKTDVKNGGYQVQGFLDALNAHSYQYKDPKDGVGRFVSPMAQELEKTAIGRSAVRQTEDGKKIVDYGRLGGIMLASQAFLNDRLNSIEKSLKLKRKN